MNKYMSLGDIISSAKVERCGNGIYPVLSMTMHNGIILQNDRFKKSLASLDQSNYKVVKKGQLVIGFPIDEGVLYVQKVVSAGIMSPAYNIWNIKNDIVDADYLELCLHSPQAMQFYKANLRGTTARRRSIPTGTLLTLKIPVPSLDNQRKIVALIAKMETLITKHNLQLASLDELVKSRFIELFGDIIGNRTLPLIRLSELADIGSSKRIYANEYVESGIPFYRSKEIRELGTGLKPSVELFIKRERYDEIREKYGVPKVGDILIAAIGATIGYSWIVDTDSPFYYKDGNLIVLSIKDNVNPIFLNHAMGILIEDFKKKGVAGSAQLALTIEKLEKMMVVNPELELQNQFAAFVAQVDKSKYCRCKSRRLLQRVASI